MIRDFTDFGFAQGELSEGAELLIVIRRSKENPEKPKHDLVIFSPSDEVEPGSSKLYVYNAVWNKESPEKGHQYIIAIMSCVFMVMYAWTSSCMQPPYV